VNAKVFDFTGITRLDLDPDRILEKAKGQLQGVIVLGFDNEGAFYGATSYADGGNALWLLEVCKMRLMEGV
jgi:hypothetical protein